MILKTLLSNRAVSNAIAVHIFSPTCYYRASSTDVPVTFNEKKLHLQKLIQEELPKPYDGPERDHVNFPRRVRALREGKVRLGFIPDEWFEFFYKKTGVTGPYVFGTGMITFLISKEWYVIEDEVSTGITLALMAIYGIKKFGPAVKEFVQKEMKKDLDNDYKVKADKIKELEDAASESKKNVWQVEGQKIMMNAKRENIHMQLETEYRRRMMEVYEQVKKRLDFQLDYVNTKRKLEQKHMVDWIVNNVVKSITPQQEKEALQKCLDDLKAIAARA